MTMAGSFAAIRSLALLPDANVLAREQARALSPRPPRSSSTSGGDPLLGVSESAPPVPNSSSTGFWPDERMQAS